MRRIKATVEYCGTNYSGFQIQPNAVTVEERLEEALGRVYGLRVSVTASGRTDSGVHALGQVIHFDVPDGYGPPAERLPFAIAEYLPSDVAVIDAEETDCDFHARYTCKKKTYKYRIIRSDISRPLEHGRAWICGYKLDVGRMRRAAEYLTGEHDFRAFMSSGSGVKTTVREIKRLVIVEDGSAVEIFVTANGFLYNMVRIIVGTLVDVGRERLEPRDVESILNSCDRGRAGATAPPEGLYLLSVEY